VGRHARRRHAPTYVVAALVALAGVFFVVWAPIGAPEPPPMPPLGQSLGATQALTRLPTSTSAPSTAAGTTAGTTTSPTPTPTHVSSCRVGKPRRLVIPALKVDAWFEQIGLDTSAKPDADGKYPLGNPKDRTQAGWYYPGPRPGSGRGTILTNGHTYRNNSAIFKEDFAKRIAIGQLIHIVQDNGSICSYAVERVWPEVDSRRDYPHIVTSEHLYDFEGPERLFLATCGGSWNAAAQNYDEISILIANPVDR
jgi:hypothetical protein